MERYRPYLHVLAGLPLGWLPRGALLYFSLTQKAATSSIKVLDHTGKVVREMPAKPEPRLHRAVWGSRGADDHVSFFYISRQMPLLHQLHDMVGREAATHLPS